MSRDHALLLWGLYASGYTYIAKYVHVQCILAQTIQEVHYTSTRSLTGYIYMSIITILVFCVYVCVSVCVSVPPEISGMGGRIAMVLTLSRKGLPGELHKLLFQLT